MSWSSSCLETGCPSISSKAERTPHDDREWLPIARWGYTSDLGIPWTQPSDVYCSGGRGGFSARAQPLANCCGVDMSDDYRKQRASRSDMPESLSRGFSEFSATEYFSLLRHHCDTSIHAAETSLLRAESRRYQWAIVSVSETWFQRVCRSRGCCGWWNEFEKFWVLNLRHTKRSGLKLIADPQ